MFRVKHITHLFKTSSERNDHQLISSSKTENGDSLQTSKNVITTSCHKMHSCNFVWPRKNIQQFFSQEPKITVKCFSFQREKNAHWKQFECLKMADSISEDVTLVNIKQLLIKSESLEKSQVSYLIERAENDCIWWNKPCADLKKTYYHFISNMCSSRLVQSYIV